MTVKALTLSRIVPVCMAGAMLMACNRDEIIESVPAPRIVLDNGSGVYTVKAGNTLTIAPVYEHAYNATYSWILDGCEISSSPQLTRIWPDAGKYYVTVTVTTGAGSASEDLSVNVNGTAAPVISLPVTGGELKLAAGTEYTITPEILNSDTDDFEITWTVDGNVVSHERSYSFCSAQTGSYDVTVTAVNADGSDFRRLTVTVLERLPYELEFPRMSYFSKSTDRHTFPGRPVYLTPLMANLAGETFSWSINGTTADCSGRTLVFTPDTAGEYSVSVTVDGCATAGVKVICADATERDRYRAATASSSPEAARVFEWVPAPGQFIGDTQTGGMTGGETTPELACGWAQERLAAHSHVSLGAFGGYIIVGFDHSIAKAGGQYDFAIMGNAFLNAAAGNGGSNEPGIVYVMQDVNGNGLPDDEWYELRGSETGRPETRQDYAVTYYRPSAPRMNVQWTDNYGGSGLIDYLGAFHRQDYYYPAWITDDSYVLRGTCLPARTSHNPSAEFWDNSAFAWGYADNIGSDNLTPESGSAAAGQRNGFSIGNAMRPDFTPIDLQYIDFIKVQTGVNSKAGWLGEVSTEVSGFEDLNISQ